MLTRKVKIKDIIEKIEGHEDIREQLLGLLLSSNIANIEIMSGQLYWGELKNGRIESKKFDAPRMLEEDMIDFLNQFLLKVGINSSKHPYISIPFKDGRVSVNVSHRQLRQPFIYISLI